MTVINIIAKPNNKLPKNSSSVSSRIASTGGSIINKWGQQVQSTLNNKSIEGGFYERIPTRAPVRNITVYSPFVLYLLVLYDVMMYSYYFVNVRFIIWDVIKYQQRFMNDFVHGSTATAPISEFLMDKGAGEPMGLVNFVTQVAAAVPF